MYQILLFIHILIAVFIVALVLLQQGKGAATGAAFGGGASQTVFGSRGSGSFLFRMTIAFGIAFFVSSIGLNHMLSSATKQARVMTLPAAPDAPVANKAPVENASPMKNIPERKSS